LGERPAGGARAGYRFMLEVTAAIEETTAAREEIAPGAFSYRGADLRRAVERALYVRLSSRQDVLDVFAGGRSSGPLADSDLEAEVVGRLLGRDGPVARPSTARLWRTARRVRWAVAPPARFGRRPDPPYEDRASYGSGQAAIAFVVDHPKFLTYLEPVLTELPSPAPLLISIVPKLDQGSAAVPVRHARAYGARWLPRPEMKHAGPALAESWALCSTFERLDVLIASERPRAVVVVEGNSAFDELANQACRRRGIPCLCIQQGWSPVAHSGFRHMSFSSMLVWGEGFRQLLEPLNPDQRFEVSGSPVFDVPASGGPERPDLSKLVSDAPALAVFLQGDSPLITRPDREALLGIATEVARRLPNVTVLVREHPGHPLDDIGRDALAAISNVLLAPSGHYSIKQVLDASAVSLSIYSTTLLESAARGTVPVVFNPTALPRSAPDLEALGAGIELREADAVTDAVIRLLQDGDERAAFAPGLAAFAERFFDGARPGAARRIQAAIESASVS
jgi:hypothetical protein